jgi:DNA-binding protein Alba
MMTTSFDQRSEPVQNNRVVPPSVLLIGKKHAANYVMPGLFRLNNTGELVIKATGSLSIVTAVDVAEIIKRDVENVITKTISLGTDSFVISTGESKRMSCIEIKMSKLQPKSEQEPAVIVQAEEQQPVQEKPKQAKKARAKKKTTTSKGRKKTAVRKKAVA